jgi:hypothetical protein
VSDPKKFKNNFFFFFFSHGFGLLISLQFWDTRPPQTRKGYFAPQREYQNAAILQMIEAVLEERPVPLRHEHPETQAQAMANMLAFSVPQEEAQERQEVESSRRRPVTLPAHTAVLWLARFRWRFYQRHVVSNKAAASQMGQAFAYYVTWKYVPCCCLRIYFGRS